jgi:hypothetical protein
MRSQAQRRSAETGAAECARDRFVCSKCDRRDQRELMLAGSHVSTTRSPQLCRRRAYSGKQKIKLSCAIGVSLNCVSMNPLH